MSELLSPLVGSRNIGAIQYLDEGLTNTILRVSVEGSTPDLLVRIYAGGKTPWEKERRLLERLTPDLPVPRVLLCHDGRGAVPYPTLVYEWIEGLTLNAMRRKVPSEELFSLADQLGRIIGRIGTVEPIEWEGFPGQGQTHNSSPGMLLSMAEERLLRGRARARLGEGPADALWQHLSRNAGNFTRLGARSASSMAIWAAGTFWWPPTAPGDGEFLDLSIGRAPSRAGRCGMWAAFSGTAEGMVKISWTNLSAVTGGAAERSTRIGGDWPGCWTRVGRWLRSMASENYRRFLRSAANCWRPFFRTTLEKVLSSAAAGPQLER